MRKLFLLILVLAVSVHSIFAQANFDVAKFNGLSMGAGASLTPTINGGFLDLGFNFFSKGNFAIRNYLEMNAGGSKNHNVYGLRERLIFAQLYAITDKFGIRGYSGADFGFSVYNGGTKSGQPFSAPFLLTPRGFGGIEFLFEDGGSTFIEAGGGANIVTEGNLPDDFSSGFAFINVGGRYYF